MDRNDLRAGCENCFGFCCVVLYFPASEGFPVDKDAGVPCPNLQPDFRCCVHESLKDLGLKGCIAYDCFGAGQKVALTIYDGHDWRQAPGTAEPMFKVFLIMRQIHEMLWYLSEALTFQTAYEIQDGLKSMLSETERLSFLSADSLLELDVAAHREGVNKLLRKTSEMVRTNSRYENKAPLKSKKLLYGGKDLIGADLRAKDLRGEDFRGACLITADLRRADLTGADFIGADLRDADLRGADLTNSIFLTQAQINTAKGDSGTKLPASLFRPQHW